VREAVAVSVLHFHGRTVQEACRQVARGLAFATSSTARNTGSSPGNGASAGEAAAQRLEAARRYSARAPLENGALGRSCVASARAPNIVLPAMTSGQRPIMW
jgi:hypothetical protein